MREDRPRKDAGTVIVVFAAVGAEHVVVGAVLVVVLEEVLGLGCPFDELPPLEFVELAPDIARILGMRDEKKQDVVKQVVGREQPDNDRRYHQQYPSKVHALFLRSVCLCFRHQCRAHPWEVSSTTASHVGSSDATSPVVANGAELLLGAASAWHEPGECFRDARHVFERWAMAGSGNPFTDCPWRPRSNRARAGFGGRTKMLRHFRLTNFRRDIATCGKSKLRFSGCCRASPLCRSLQQEPPSPCL